MRAWRIVLISSAFAAFAACTGDDLTGNSSSGDSPDGGAGEGGTLAEGGALASSVTLQVGEAPALVQGKNVGIEVTLVRAGTPEALTLTATDLGEGVSSAPVAVLADAAKGVVTLTATAAAPHGPRELRITAQNAAGEVRGDVQVAVLVRGASGTLDTTFGEGGKAPIVDDPTYVTNVLLVGNGAYLTGRKQGDFFAARALADGKPDTTFAATGSVVTDLGGPDDNATASAIDAAGKLVLMGTAGNPLQLGAARYDTTGTLDANFGKPLATPSGSTAAGTTCGLLDRKGRILLAGHVQESGSTKMAITRLTGTGGLDTTFNTIGSVYFTASTRAIAIAEYPDGRLLVGGASGTDAVIARLTEAGAPDSAFGTAGVKTTFIYGTKNENVQGLVGRSDGTVLVSGHLNDGGGAPTTSYVALFDATGTNFVDTFGSGFAMGRTFLDLAPGEITSVGQGIVIGPDGAIWVSGVVGASSLFVVKLRPNGTFDPDFADAGKLVIPTGGAYASARIAIGNDGRMWLVASKPTGGYQLFRYWI